MIRAVGIVWVVLLALSPSALASSCVVPLIKTLNDQTVVGTMYAVSGKSCSIILISSRGPIYKTHVVAQPAHGHVSLSGGKLVYVSHPGYVGDDRFVYARQGTDTIYRPITRTVDVSVKVADHSW